MRGACEHASSAEAARELELVRCSHGRGAEAGG